VLSSIEPIALGHQDHLWRLEQLAQQGTSVSSRGAMAFHLELAPQTAAIEVPPGWWRSTCRRMDSAHRSAAHEPLPPGRLSLRRRCSSQPRLQRAHPGSPSSGDGWRQGRHNRSPRGLAADGNLTPGRCRGGAGDQVSGHGLKKLLLPVVGA